MKFENLGVEEALNHLVSRYPDERVAIDIWTGPEDGFIVWASVGECLGRHGRERVVRSAPTAIEAALALTAVATNRSPQDMARRRIAELRMEIAALEAKLDDTTGDACGTN